MSEAAKMPELPGEVTITLAGQDVTLRASLRAARAVNAISDGFAGAYQGLSRYNMSTFAVVIAAGLGKRENKDVVDIEEQVFATGLESLVAPVTRFVTMLANGGRDPKPAEGDEKAGATDQGNE